MSHPQTSVHTLTLAQWTAVAVPLLLTLTTGCGASGEDPEPTPTGTPSEAALSTPTPEASDVSPTAAPATPTATPDDTLKPLSTSPVGYSIASTITTLVGTGAYGDDCVEGQPCDGYHDSYGNDEISISLFNLTGGYAGDGGQGTAALLNWPTGVAISPDGTIAIADQENAVVRCVSADGVISTCGKSYYDPNTPTDEYGFSGPGGVAYDATGTLFAVDTWFATVTRMVPGGKHVVYAGALDQAFGYSGDGGPATKAQMNYPTGARLDSNGNLFIADYLNNAIRRVDAQTLVITTVAGTGELGLYHEGGLATESALNFPGGIALDAQDNLYITDNFSNAIRRVDARTNIITTVAGTGVAGFSGDGGLAKDATLNFPTGADFDSKGNLFFTDTRNNLVRVITTDGKIYTVAGNGLHRDDYTGTFSGDGGDSLEASLDNPYAVEVDADDNLLIADTNNNRIRKVTFLK